MSIMMKIEERIEWLASLKAGDKVAGSIQRWGGGVSIMTIERITETQFVMSGNSGSRYRRESGRQVGGGSERIQPITKEILAANETNALNRWLCGLTDNALHYPPAPVIRAMKAAYDEAMKAEGGAA